MFKRYGVVDWSDGYYSVSFRKSVPKLTEDGEELMRVRWVEPSQAQRVWSDGWEYINHGDEYIVRARHAPLPYRELPESKRPLVTDEDFDEWDNRNDFNNFHTRRQPQVSPAWEERPYRKDDENVSEFTILEYAWVKVLCFFARKLDRILGRKDCG